MEVNKKDTAVLFTDPQNDFLSEEGVTWGLVGKSVEQNNTRENMERIFKTAKENEFEVFVSPHYYFPTDHEWQFGGTIENVMHEIHMFDRTGALTLDGFKDSGADWLERFKPYIEDGKTVVVSPHKVDVTPPPVLTPQLRKRNINKVILGGMSANLCVEAHMRELLEQGFQVAVVKDATAGALHPELGDGYEAAVINFGFIANDVLSTDDVVRAMET